MTKIELIKCGLLWCFAINMGLLLWWWLWLWLAHDWVYRMHSKFFKVSEEQFNAIHYSGMMVFKLAIFAGFLVPYLALVIVR